ncbi:MAG: hypothetical protein H0Z39_03565 [Peptococcaceae bacterium]|nr:hypothetical protein [Peptococcaceae bacterium]
MGINIEGVAVVMGKLSCGCIRGSFLCPTAVKLWQKVNQEYERAKVTGDYSGYERAKEEYERHFQVTA